MRGPISRILILTLSCLLSCSQLRSQDPLIEGAAAPITGPGTDAPADPPPEPTANDSSPRPEAPGGQLPPLAHDAPLSEDPPPFIDAYPPTVDNLSGRGLFHLLDPFPLAQLHLQIPVNTLRVLKEGDGRFEWNANWANSFALEDNVTIDAETYSLDLGGWYALRSDFYLGASISILARDSGVLDGFIDGFHDAFGLSDGRRGKRPGNAYLIAVTDDNGNTQNLDRGVGLGDLVLKTHWNLNLGDRWMPAVALESFVTLPTSTNGFGSSGVDLGMSVSFYKTVYEDFHIYAVLGGTLLTNSRTEGIKYQKSVIQATLGVEYALLEDVSLIVQHMSYSTLLREPPPLDKHRNYIAAGLKWEFTQGYSFEFSIVENLSPFENSSDLAFSLGFQFSL